MIVRELFTSWGFNVDFKNLNKMDKKIDNIAKGMGRVGRGFKDMSRRAQEFGLKGTLFISAPIALLGRSIIKTSGDFEKSMNNVSALTQATGEEFIKLEALAKSLGSTTQFSAKESADAMGFLAQAGLTTKQILGALPSTLLLAGAADIEFAETADIVTNVMSGMGIKSDELGNVVDIMTKTFVSSNTNLKQLGQAMKFAGSVSKGFNFNLKDTVATLGSMGNAGIQAEMAGTALRGSFQKLSNPSKEAQRILKTLGVQTSDSTGKFRNLLDILDDLKKANITTAQTLKLLGVRAGTGINTLLQGGIEKVRAFSKSLDDAGGIAKQINDTKLKGLNGALKQLASRWEALKIAIGNAGLLRFATDTSKSLSRLIKWFGNLSKTTLLVITIFGTFFAIVFPLVFLLGSMGFAIIGLASAYGILKTVIIAVRAQFLIMQGAILVVPILLAIAGAAFLLFLDDLNNWAAGNNSIIGESIGSWDNYLLAWRLLWDDVVAYLVKKKDSLFNIMNKLVQNFIDLGAMMASPFTNVINKVGELVETLKKEFPVIKKITDSIGGFLGTVSGFLGIGGDNNNPAVTPNSIASTSDIQSTAKALAPNNNNSNKNFNSKTEVTLNVNAALSKEGIEETAEQLEALVAGINERELRKTKNELLAAP